MLELLLANITADSQPASQPTSQPHLAVTGFFQVLIPFILLPLVATGITMVLVPACSRLAFRFGIVDRPDTRKRHGRIVPYAGGVAMLIGWLAALWAYEGRFGTALLRLFLISLASIAICVVGLYDDKFKIRGLNKLLAQIVVAVFLFVNGIGLHLAGNLFAAFAGTASSALPIWLDFPLSLIATIFLITGACNSANLIDGLDGLCSGVTSIMAIGLTVIAVQATLSNGSVTDTDTLRISLSLALFGATMGFLSYNSPPARIFMGDAGSMFIGLNIGVFMLLLAEQNPKCLLGGLMCFGLPIADSALAIFRRWQKGQSIFTADNWHLHHLLIRRGLNVRQAVWVLYLLSTTFTLTGVTVTLMQLRHAFIVIASFAVNFLIMAVLIGLGADRRSTVDTNACGIIPKTRPDKTPPTPEDSFLMSLSPPEDPTDSSTSLKGLVPSDEAEIMQRTGIFSRSKSKTE